MSFDISYWFLFSQKLSTPFSITIQSFGGGINAILDSESL